VEPVWKLADSVSLSTEFSLTESFKLAITADAFIWSDFLGAPYYLNRIQWLTGMYSTVSSLTGVYSTKHSLIGRYSSAQRLEGGI